MAEKMGEEYTLTSDCEYILKLLQNRRAITTISITWYGNNKKHMKWLISITNPKYKEVGLNEPMWLQEYGSSPIEVLKKMAKRIGLTI